MLIHPDFWSRRRLAFPGRNAVELPTTSKAALEGAGFEIVEQREPSFLLDGSLLVIGEVDRTTEFERGFPGHEFEPIVGPTCEALASLRPITWFRHTARAGGDPRARRSVPGRVHPEQRGYALRIHRGRRLTPRRSRLSQA